VIIANIKSSCKIRRAQSNTELLESKILILCVLCGFFFRGFSGGIIRRLPLIKIRRKNE